MIWVPREPANYIVPTRHLAFEQSSVIRGLVWEGDSIDIHLARYVGIYSLHDRHLAQLQAVLTICLYAPLPTSTALHIKEPPPEVLTFRKWVDDYVL